MEKLTVGGQRSRLRSLLPERELLVRSQGRVRVIALTTRMQLLLAAAFLMLTAALAVSVATAGLSEYRMQTRNAALLERQAKAEETERRVAAYRREIAAMADDLERRQDFIDQVLPMLPEDVREEFTRSAKAGPVATKISAAVPEAAALIRLEARQIAFVDALTRYAEQRSARAEEALRELGLDPKAMLASGRVAQGGPFEKLATSRDGSTDPRFERLGLSLSRMDALERGLQGIPQVMPADIRMISSGFGYRSDPFTGGGAMHSGLDFGGPTGAPIHAAADGRVSFVGVRSGYGNVVEISHGNGLMTRYAHMSAFKARSGQNVEAGAVIGAIGSTGRSTGPHLHFEVRIHGRAVNPRPFLETAPHVLKEVRGE